MAVLLFAVQQDADFITKDGRVVQTDKNGVAGSDIAFGSFLNPPLGPPFGVNPNPGHQNVASLLGATDGGGTTVAFWEDATGPWANGGRPRHKQTFLDQSAADDLDLNGYKATIFLVIPNAPFKSPVLP